MALLSEARFGVGDPTVQLPDNRLTPRGDRSTAQAIESFGAIASDIGKGVMKGQLKNELEEAGNAITSLNAGYPQLQKDIEEGRVNPDSESFYRLSLAAEQGKISQQRAQLEAEVLLRSKIAQAPGFADEFRRTAQEALGFDPTGAALNTLFLSGPDASSTTLTQEQKDIEQAQAMQAGGAVSTVEEGVRLINEARVAELRQQTTSAAIRKGKINSGKIAVEAANRVSDAAAPVLIQAMQQVRNQGGIEDVESFKNSILAATQVQIRQIENQMAESTEHQYDPEAYNTMRSRAEETADALVTILDNQDIMNVLSRRSDILDSTSNIGLYQVAPELAILAGLGESAISSYLDLSVLAQNDPRKRAELIKRNPNFAWIAEIDSLVSGDIAKSLKARAEGTLPARIQTGEIDEEAGKAVIKAESQRAADGDVTPEEFDQIIEAAMQTDMKRTAISAIARNPASYSNMTEVNRQESVKNIRQEQQRQVLNIAQGLNAQGFQLKYSNGKFQVVDPNLEDDIGAGGLAGARAGALSRLGSDRVTMRSVSLAREAGVEESLNYLNNQITPIMRNVRWANEAGYGTPESWANSVVSQSQVTGPLALPQAGSGLTAQPAGAPNPIEFSSPLEVDVAMNEGLHTPADFERTNTVGLGRDLNTKPMRPKDWDIVGLPQDTSPAELANHLYENPDVAQRLMASDLQEAKQELQQATFVNQETEEETRVESVMADLNRTRQDVLVQMAYQMGGVGVAGFQNMLTELAKDRPNWQEVANHMMDSKWQREDSPGRARRLILRMIRGE